MKILKIPKYFYKIREFSFFLFHNVFKEKMFTNEINYGREASLKPGIIYLLVKSNELILVSGDIAGFLIFVLTEKN